MTTPVLSTQSRPTRICFARLLAAQQQDEVQLRAGKGLEGFIAFGWVTLFAPFFNSVNLGVLRPILPVNTRERTTSLKGSLEKEIDE